MKTLLVSAPRVEAFKRWHNLSSNTLCFAGVTLFLNALELNLSNYLEKSPLPNKAEREWHEWVVVFFTFLV